MYKKILVPLDGSKAAEYALPYARCLARGLQIPIELLGVVDAVELTRQVSAAEGLFLNSLIEDQTCSLENYLQTIGRNFPRGAVQCRVENGNAADVIIESAAVDQGTLIAMATHGRSGLNRWLVGSVAEKILRGASNPLLLVRAGDTPVSWNIGAFKSVIVPLDGSELAESVLPTAAAIAKNLDLEIILLRVYGIPYAARSTGEGFFDNTQLEGFIASLRTEALDYLEEKAGALRKSGVKNITALVHEGLPADEIISCARQMPNGLVAMCTHGRSGMKRWVLGSVTETVVRHSGDPVLIVRAPVTEPSS